MGLRRRVVKGRQVFEIDIAKPYSDELGGDARDAVIRASRSSRLMLHESRSERFVEIQGDASSRS